MKSERSVSCNASTMLALQLFAVDHGETTQVGYLIPNRRKASPAKKRKRKLQRAARKARNK